MRSSLLLQESTLQVLPSLAEAIGLEQAIVVQQLYFLLQNPNNGKVLADGERYIFNTYEEWQQQFPWWSIRTVQRVFVALEQNHFVVSRQPEGSISRRKYYRLNVGAMEKLTYELLNEKRSEKRKRVVDHAKLASSGTCQIGIFEHAKLASSSFREYNTENTAERTHIPCEAPPRDVCMLALAAVECDNTSEVTSWKPYAKALASIRRVTPNVTPAQIRERAANWATHFSVSVTAPALAKHWARCAKMRDFSKGKPAAVDQDPPPEAWPMSRMPQGVSESEAANWYARKEWVNWCNRHGKDPDTFKPSRSSY